MPYIEDDYDGNDMRPEVGEERGRERRVVRKILDMIRWRYSGSLPESNTRLVEFEDGSIYLQVGNEYFEVRENVLSEQQYLYVRHKQDGETPSFLACHARVHARLVATPADPLTRQLHRIRSRYDPVLELAYGCSMRRYSASKPASRIVAGSLADPLKDKYIKEQKEQEKRELMLRYGSTGMSDILNSIS